MKTSTRLLAYCRAPRGQVSLIAVAFLAAMIASFCVLGLRSTWFVGTVYERFPSEQRQPGAGELRTLSLDIAAGRAAAGEIEGLTAQELIVVYGVLIDDTSLAADGLLVRALWDLRGGEMLERIRRTLAAGNRAQRLRALGILGTMSDASLIDDAVSVCRFARQRAGRCGDDDLAARAQAVLSDLENR